MHLIRFLHQLLKGTHAGNHPRIIERADAEVEILERLRAHGGLLGHRRSRPAQHHPFGFVHSVVQDWLHGLGVGLNLGRRDVRILKNII